MLAQQAENNGDAILGIVGLVVLGLFLLFIVGYETVRRRRKTSATKPSARRTAAPATDKPPPIPRTHEAATRPASAHVPPKVRAKAQQGEIVFIMPVGSLSPPRSDSLRRSNTERPPQSPRTAVLEACLRAEVPFQAWNLAQLTGRIRTPRLRRSSDNSPAWVPWIWNGLNRSSDSADLFRPEERRLAGTAKCFRTHAIRRGVRLAL
jgi:hypothetical protein